MARNAVRTVKDLVWLILQRVNVTIKSATLFFLFLKQTKTKIQQPFYNPPVLNKANICVEHIYSHHLTRGASSNTNLLWEMSLGWPQHVVCFL